MGTSDMSSNGGDDTGMRGQHDQGYKYVPFTNSSTEIRLLQFAAKSHEESSSHIALSMQTWSRSDAPAYSALSYTWGPLEPQREISIDGARMRVRPNCLFALRQLSAALQPSSYYWIDAICINQEDVEEKNSQVQFMGNLYENALEVVVSLGEHDDYSRNLFNLLLTLEMKMSDEQSARRTGQPASEDLGKRMYLDVMLPDEDSPPWFRWFDGLPFAAAQEILQMLWQFSERPYWRRVWIYQETMLARRARLLCGSTTVQWDTLTLFCSDVLSSIEGPDFTLSGRHEILTGPVRLLSIQYREYRPLEELSHSERAAEEYQELKRRLSLSHMHSLLAARIGGESTAKSNHLPHMLTANLTRLCTDPRDRIYGLLHLVRGPPEPLVDYGRSLLQLGIEAVRYFDPRTSWTMAERDPAYFDRSVDFLLGDYVTTLQQQLGIDRQSEDFAQMAMGRLGLGPQQFKMAEMTTSELERVLCAQPVDPSEAARWYGGDPPQEQVLDGNFKAENCCIITKSKDDKFSAALIVYSSDCEDRADTVEVYDELNVNRAITDCISEAHRLWPDVAPVPLHGTLMQSGGGKQRVVVGLCSGNTRAGDILARPSDMNGMLYALILRPASIRAIDWRESYLYEAVGQALLVRGCESDRDKGLQMKERQNVTPAHVAFTMMWGIEDAFLFYSREADELKRARTHHETTFSDLIVAAWRKNKGPVLPAVPADFVRSAIRLVTNVTSERLSSLAVSSWTPHETFTQGELDGETADEAKPAEESVGIIIIPEVAKTIILGRCPR